ncbi:thiamine diphosphokinase [Promineifilum sp.]|uniref:thiamine diphosphokinase n=1 Tax=Promineifilum sp. TaxID=2664178 RepID=UPI0035AE6AA4
MKTDRTSVLIFANGVLDDTTWIAPYLDRARAVIAADGGLRHLLALGRRPDVLIGDLDSLPPGVAAELAGWETEVIRYPAAKDATDLELALLLARQRFPDCELLILGGFGGRLDQTLANILLLAHPDLTGHPVRFVEARESAWLVTDETRIDGRPGDTVSLIPLGGPARVVETTGLRWPLRDETLAFGPARGISNELMGELAVVRLGAGMLLCVHGVQGSRGAGEQG